MDERLSRSNRLPGSEKLTRPEEIGQLSKYLKSIKEVYEESTRLEDQVLGVTGYSTGKIPKINSLEKKSVKAPENQGETPDLSQKILGVPGGKDGKNKLEDKRLELKDTNIVSELDDRVITSPGNQGGDVSRLGEVIKKIQDVRDQSLSEKRLNLLDERYLALEDTRLDLQAIIDTSLENKRINLKDERETKLGDTKLGLTDNRQVVLEDTRLDISDSRDQILEDKVIGLKEPEEIKLENKRLDIQDDGVRSLETKRIEISADEDIELGDKKLEIKDTRDIGLREKRLNLEDSREAELENTRIDLKGPEEVKLGNTRLDLTDSRDTELEGKKIELEDERIVKLGDKKIEIKTTLSDKVVELEETGSAVSELETTRLDLTDDQVLDLSDKILGLTDERNSELSNKKLELFDNRDLSLGDKKVEISDERNSELANKRIGIEDDRDIELSEKILQIKDENTPELENTRIDITDSRDTKLEETRLDLKDQRETNLEDKILNISDSRTPELEDTLVKLTDEYEPELENKKIELVDDRENSLGEKRLDLEDEREESLSDKLLSLLDEREPELTNKKVNALDNENGEPEELYDSLIGAPDNENGEPKELYDSLIAIPEDKNKRENDEETSLSNKVISAPESYNEVPNLSDVESLKEYTSKLSDNELYEFAMKLANEGDNASGDHDGWLQKIENLMSAYLSSDILTPKRAIEFRDAVNNTLEMSYFGSQAALRVPVDTSSGTIWAKAEEMVSEQITGTNRRDALDEMIVKLVDYKKSNLPSLPGSSLVDASIGALKGLASSVSTLVSGHPNPMNKPLHANGSALPYGLGDSIFQAANSRTQSGSLDPTGDTTMGLFLNRYWSSTSFKTTLEDLCPVLGEAPVASLTDLKSLLKASPYITTPGKFMTDTKGSYNTQTLDTNMYWEVVFEPFCMDSGPCNNGGYSYLPSIREINYENETYHQVKTRYGFWAPINGFELQKSKLVTKSLQLYEGEIVYPTGMEFTNELRLTFVDDSLKSWRRYFEKCAQVAVFNSTPHGRLYYQSPIISSTSGYTQIDKNNICIAPYKNLAFNIKIYILSPQLNTLKRYNLLCVLKDFSEEYVGEVDSGGTDLNVSFSIVGENPGENKATNYTLLGKDVTESIKKQRKLDIQKTLSNAIRSSIGLL